MKFHINRVSIWGEKSPCEEAYKALYTKIDVRSASKPEVIPAYCGETEWWYGKGTNHRVVDNEITRDFPNSSRWEISIATLEDLVAFTEKYGSCIIDKNTITIYDDYIE